MRKAYLYRAAGNVASCSTMLLPRLLSGKFYVKDVEPAPYYSREQPDFVDWTVIGLVAYKICGNEPVVRSMTGRFPGAVQLPANSVFR